MKHILAFCAATAFASPAFAEQPVTVNFTAEMDGKAFSCIKTYVNLGNTDGTLQPL